MSGKKEISWADQNPARQANKVARRKRERDIIARWNRRWAIRSCQLAVANENGPNIISELMYYSQWASFRVLVETVDPRDQLGILAQALRIIELKEMPYSEYLKSAEWKQKADIVKQRYDGRCTLDERHMAEHAHHRTYDRVGREYLTDLIPLCGDCHAKFHGKQR